MDTMHPDDDLLADRVLGACTPGESEAVLRHVARCERCAARLDRLTRTADWLAASRERRPPARLRTRVLTAARAARAPGEPDMTALLGLYSVQLEAFDDLLGRLTADHWAAPVARYPTVRHLVAHLAGNDALVSSSLGLREISTETDVARRWREQANGLVREVGRAGPLVLEHEVLLAGGSTRHPLRGALTQRAFETWIHADDIRASLRLPLRDPAPEQLRHIIGFACRLLPGALDAAKRGRPGRAIGLQLSGPGGATRVVALSAAAPPAVDAAAVATVSTSAVEFCRLLAGRRTPADAGVVVEGDPRAARDFLAVVVTMGCD